MQDNRNKINALLNQANVLKDRKRDLKQELANLNLEECIALSNYRIESTVRVLTFILDEYRQGKLPDLETLLVHCLNTLRGNIDGVELNLDDYVSKEIAVLPLTTASSSEQEE